MAQRAGFEKDANACNIYITKDNVVFPGGQADAGESDLQACKR
jgi:8-oxo-dGTP pyrophosphatase MutT (NUDIX family)